MPLGCIASQCSRNNFVPEHCGQRPGLQQSLMQVQGTPLRRPQAATQPVGAHPTILGTSHPSAPVQLQQVDIVGLWAALHFHNSIWLRPEPKIQHLASPVQLQQVDIIGLQATQAARHRCNDLGWLQARAGRISRRRHGAVGGHECAAVLRRGWRRRTWRDANSQRHGGPLILIPKTQP